MSAAPRSAAAAPGPVGRTAAGPGARAAVEPAARTAVGNAPASKTAGKPAVGQSAAGKTAGKSAAGKAAAGKAAGKTAAGKTAAGKGAAGKGAAADAGRAGAGRAGRGTGGRRSRRRYIAAGGLVIVLAGAAVSYKVLYTGPAAPLHRIVTPRQIGSYVQAPALAASMRAAQVRRTIVAQSNGEASHVVAAVYESTPGQPAAGHSAGPGTPSASPPAAPQPGSAANSQIVLFIGGNLAGTSPAAFITSFIGKLPGAVTTSAGPRGGEAACVPAAGGNPAECAWADEDTFGLVASPTLSEQALASELRQMRLQTERKLGHH